MAHGASMQPLASASIHDDSANSTGSLDHLFQGFAKQIALEARVLQKQVSVHKGKGCYEDIFQLCDRLVSHALSFQLHDDSFLGTCNDTTQNSTNSNTAPTSATEPLHAEDYRSGIASTEVEVPRHTSPNRSTIFLDNLVAAPGHIPPPPPPPALFRFDPWAGKQYVGNEVVNNSVSGWEKYRPSRDIRDVNSMASNASNSNLVGNSLSKANGDKLCTLQASNASSRNASASNSNFRASAGENMGLHQSVEDFICDSEASRLPVVDVDLTSCGKIYGDEETTLTVVGKAWNALPKPLGTEFLLKVTLRGCWDLEHLGCTVLKHLNVRNPPGFHAEGLFVSDQGEYLVEDYTSNDVKSMATSFVIELFPDDG